MFQERITRNTDTKPPKKWGAGFGRFMPEFLKHAAKEEQIEEQGLSRLMELPTRRAVAAVLMLPTGKRALVKAHRRANLRRIYFERR